MPAQRLGQHFLKDKKILCRIADLAGDSPIIEIGPGTGNLTRYLIKKTEVVAIEKDTSFASSLSGLPHLEVIWRDVREVNLEEIARQKGWLKYQIFGNLPFYLEKPIILKVAQLSFPPEQAVFLINREVAEGFGSKKSVFALSVEFWVKVKRLFKVPAKAFSPPPKVDGEVIKLYKFRYPFRFPAEREEVFPEFQRFLRQCFSSPRKYLLNNLVPLADKSFWQKTFSQLGIDLKSRAEELNLEDFLQLFFAYYYAEETR
ncbi:ribosomal RNA small subunit methyltransferase A [bacterium]|nr:ribosomal RNA small subunit methyltransferase A [bacterium]